MAPGQELTGLGAVTRGASGSRGRCFPMLSLGLPLGKPYEISLSVGGGAGVSPALGHNLATA